jgi:hypothetical protein
VDVHVEEKPRQEIPDLSTNHPDTASTAHAEPAPCPPLDVPPALPPCDVETAANPTLPTAPPNCGMDFDQKLPQTAWHEPSTLPHDPWQSRSWISLATQQHHVSTSETPVASTSQIHHAGSDPQPEMVFHDSNLLPEMFFEDSTLIGAYAQALNAEFTVFDHMDLDSPSSDRIPVSEVRLIYFSCGKPPSHVTSLRRILRHLFTTVFPYRMFRIYSVPTSFPTIPSMSTHSNITIRYR